MKWDSIIFDVDGTLWYSCEQVGALWSEAATEYLGRPVVWDGPLLQKEFGKTMDDIMLDLLPELSDAQRKELGEYCFEKENNGLRDNPGILYPGVAETLEELAKEHRMFIVSNCQKGYIEVLLDCYGLRDCFEGWLCWGDTMVEKDQTIRIVMDRYGLHNPVYVGDTQGDANACKKAGIEVIFASYGLGQIQPEDYTAAVSEFAQLKELLR